MSGPAGHLPAQKYFQRLKWGIFSNVIVLCERNSVRLTVLGGGAVIKTEVEVYYFRLNKAALKVSVWPFPSAA